MIDHGIYIGASGSDVYKTEDIQLGPNVIESTGPMSRVYVGTDLVWPDYREEIYIFTEDTLGRLGSAAGDSRQWWWNIDVPEWATVLDLVSLSTGGRGGDGGRNVIPSRANGESGGVWGWSADSDLSMLDMGTLVPRMGIPGTTMRNPAPHEWRMPPRNQIIAYQRHTNDSRSMFSDFATVDRAGSTGTGYQPTEIFGIVFLAASGEPGLGNDAAPYGTGGGGGGGVGLAQTPGTGGIGSAGYVWVRFRNAALPEGYVPPESMFDRVVNLP